jgi:putative transposase
MEDLEKTRYAVFRLKYHVVFVTKYRKKVLTKEVRDYLEEILLDIAKRLNIKILEFNGEEDHVHILLSMLPRHTPSAIINILKGISSRKLRKRFPFLKKV